jgi:hypothetical protein
MEFNMFIGNNVEVKFNNPSEEFTLGIHSQTGNGFPIDELTGETDFNAEPKEVTVLIIGFLIFNIYIYY